MWFPAVWLKCLGPEGLEISSSVSFGAIMSTGAERSDPWRIRIGVCLTAWVQTQFWKCRFLLFLGKFFLKILKNRLGFHNVIENHVRDPFCKSSYPEAFHCQSLGAGGFQCVLRYLIPKDSQRGSCSFVYHLVMRCASYIQWWLTLPAVPTFVNKAFFFYVQKVDVLDMYQLFSSDCPIWANPRHRLTACIALAEMYTIMAEHGTLVLKSYRCVPTT